MKYSISNIAWGKEQDGMMYSFLQKNGIQGIEIAPTRLFENPYDNLETAHRYAAMLKNKYSLTVCSMQSIWYGVSENIFAGRQDRRFLSRYTKKAIDFARSMNIGNMVFGCPKNRNIPRNMPKEQAEEIACEFFFRLGEYARGRGTVLSIEPNPVIYNTNFLTDTKSAREFIKKVNSRGIGLNVDMGTVIYNKENPHLVKTYKNIVNHIHISMPGLESIEMCREYTTLKKVLEKTEYDKYISIEMKNQQDIQKVMDTVLFVREAF